METLIQIGYLVALVCFVLGIKGMSHPDTARRGNWTLALGMGLATLVTLMQPGLGNLPLILISLGLGSWWGMRMSSKAQMTEMPQMVSLLNGFGGPGRRPGCPLRSLEHVLRGCVGEFVDGGDGHGGLGPILSPFLCGYLDD